MDEGPLNTSFDPTRRELCPDGNCLGVIGADGRCKICGTPSPHGPRADTEAPTTEIAAKPSSPPERAPQASSGNAAEGDAFDPEARQLCPDGTCLGVIGADGRCKICGTPAT